MTSTVSICNRALSLVGHDQQIESLTESSTEAELCNRHYSTALETLLDDYQWGFATTFAALSKLTDTDLEFDYVYSQPSDCLRVLKLTIDGNKSVEYPYEIRSGDKIATDLDDAYAKYVQNITDPTRFPPLFRKCLEFLLAAEIAMPLTGNSALSDSLLRYYNLNLQKAMSEDAREDGDEKLKLESDYANARL